MSKPQHHLLSVGEIALIAEALRMAANRHISYGQYKPHLAGPHDRKAEAMRKLRDRLVAKKEAA